MKKGWLWGGFGALLLVGVLSGYAPDAMLASELRGAREAGWLAPPPFIASADDARPLYQAAAQKYADGWNLLGNDFARQVKAPAPHVVKYLDAMVEASKRPRCSTLGTEWNGAYYGRPEADVVSRGALALAARATDEASLLPAARMAAHLGAQDAPVLATQWATVVTKILDRAAGLGLPSDARARLVAAMGPLLTPREALRRHIASTVRRYERERREGGSVSRTRDETVYLRFWRGFLARSPEGKGFVEAVRDANGKIDDVESRNRYGEIGPYTPTGPGRWSAWAEAVERADERLASVR